MVDGPEDLDQVVVVDAVLLEVGRSGETRMKIMQRAPLGLGIGLATAALVLTGVAVSAGACVVGTGGSASCTDAALNACLPGGGSFDGTVTFNCGGPATIDISAGAGGTGTKSITVNTTIDGGGLVTVSGGNAVRVFAVEVGVTFVVQNLTIADGNAGAGNGGGIFDDGGTVTLKNSILANNRALAGGGIHQRLSGTLTVIDSTFSGNNAASGGGISSSGGTVIVSNSNFDQNTVSGDGGGIYNSMTTLRVTNSTFYDNDATRWGGGITNIANGNATVTNCTFDLNDAGTDGGGIQNEDGTLTLTNTVIANSTDGGDCVNADTFVDGGHNLIEDTGADACGLTDGTNGNIIGQDPNLDPTGLQDNGGPTQTIAVFFGSPAINAGDQSVCANTSGTAPVNGLDQRGVARPGGGFPNCTIGAYEFERAPAAAAPMLSPLVLLGLALLLASAGVLSVKRNRGNRHSER